MPTREISRSSMADYYTVRHSTTQTGNETDNGDHYRSMVPDSRTNPFVRYNYRRIALCYSNRCIALYGNSRCVDLGHATRVSYPTDNDDPACDDDVYALRRPERKSATLPVATPAI